MHYSRVLAVLAPLAVVNTPRFLTDVTCRQDCSILHSADALAAVNFLAVVASFAALLAFTPLRYVATFFSGFFSLGLVGIFGVTLYRAAHPPHGAADAVGGPILWTVACLGAPILVWAAMRSERAMRAAAMAAAGRF